MNLTSHQITRKGNLKNHRIRRLFDIKTAHQLDRRENHLSDTRDSHYASLQKPDHTFIRAHWKQQIVRVKRRSQLHSFGQIFVRQCGIGDGMQRKIGRTGQRAEVREEFDDWRSDGDRTNLHADRCSEKRFFVRREDWRKQGNATHREGNLRRKRPFSPCSTSEGTPDFEKSRFLCILHPVIRQFVHEKELRRDQ